MKIDPLTRRVTATQKTLDRFQGRDFKWGSVDCAKMGAFHLRQFGHKPPPASKLRYRSPIKARACLKDLGCDDLPQMMDKLGLIAQPPARAIVGDIVSFEADDPIGAIGVVIGNGNMFCFHESTTVPVMMTMGKIDRSWSVT